MKYFEAELDVISKDL